MESRRICEVFYKKRDGHTFWLVSLSSLFNFLQSLWNELQQFITGKWSVRFKGVLSMPDTDSIFRLYWTIQLFNFIFRFFSKLLYRVHSHLLGLNSDFFYRPIVPVPVYLEPSIHRREKSLYSFL
jgi:hypothetical protein